MRIARWLAPEEFAALEKQKAELEQAVNGRVADILFKMDPFEPLMKKYNVIFSEEWDKPEDKLNDQSRLTLFMWAYGVKKDPSFIHLTDWIRNTQGNATLRKAAQNDEWFYGRAAIATITLFVSEVGRLASHYEKILAERNGAGFDQGLVTE